MGLIDSEYEFLAVSDPLGILHQSNDYVAQHQNGSMLFMGHSGIHVFDGRKIRLIPNEIEGGGTAHVIRGVYTRNGTLISPGSNRQISKLTKKETFVPIAQYDSIGVRRAILIHGDPHFSDGVVMSTNDGRWISLREDGASFIISDSSKTGPLPPFSVRYGDQTGELWMYNTHGEIWRVLWDGETWLEELTVTLRGAGDLLVLENEILVAAAEGIYSVTYSESTDSYTATKWYPVRITKFTQTSDGRIHMISPGVYHLFDGTQFYTKSLPISSHFRIFADREDNIWLPGRDGIDLVRKRYFPNLTGNTNLGSRYGLISGENGLSYLIHSNRLYRADVNANLLSEPILDIGALSDFEYMNGYLDGNGLLWMYGWAEMMVLDTNRNYRVLAKRTGGYVTSHYVYNGEVYMHTMYHGIFQFDARQNAFVKVNDVPDYMHYFAFINPESYLSKHVFRSIETAFIHHQSKSETVIDVPEVYHGRSVLTMIFSQQLNTLFIALTDGTLLAMNPETYEFNEIYLERLGILEPLLSFELTALTLWITINSGIFGLNLEHFGEDRFYDDEPIFLNHLVGLPSTNTGLNTFSFVDDAHSRTWISTSRGTFIFNTDRDAVNPVAPGLQVNGIYDLAGNVLHESGSNPVILPKGKRNIRFDVSVIGFRSPKQNRLRYRIAEIDENWYQSESNVLPAFQNLKPGTYHLEMIAENASVISANEASIITFTVPPYFYETTAFKILLIAFGVLFIFGLISYRERTQRKRNELLEQTVKDRTREFKLQKEETEKANEVIQKQSEDLIRLDALKNKMYANISHELRSPVTLIKGPLSQIIEHDKGTLPESVRVNLERTYRNSERLEKLVEQLLDLTRIDRAVMAVHPKPVNLNKQLDWIIEAFRSYAEFKKINLQFKKPKTSVYINTDTEMLEKVFMNILSNAVKFTRANGLIEVELKTDNNFAEIAFRDTGTGIPPEHIDRIFDRYYKSGNENVRNAEGLGVGLALSREFIELMHGTISVESTLGEGSCFYIRFNVFKGELPASEPVSTSAKQLKTIEFPIPSESAQPKAATHTILIVDDNPDMTGFISNLMLPHYSYLTAYNGKEALTLLSKHEIDLVITDYMMPEFDGISLVKAMQQREAWKQIPVILLTAIKNEDVMLHGFQIGINDYITKPFSPKELLARIGALLRMLDMRQKSKSDTHQSSESSTLSLNETRIKRLTAYIKANIKEKITAELLAEQLHISKKQLTRILQATTGLSPADFIREVRLQQARQLFETHQKGTISEVMYQVGFTHQFNFSKRYEERFGRKPADYF